MSGRVVHALRALLAPGQRFEFEARPSPWGPAPSRAHLYVHVPFCRGACPYCPYLRGAFRPEEVPSFLAALRREADLLARWAGRVEVPSVYWGGGSPALLGPHLASAMATLRSCFPVEGPVALELSPVDAGEATLDGLREAGVSLVSLGVQSFEDGRLRFLGRRYGGEEAARALERVRGAGFSTVNVDLMFALPGQRTAAWVDDLRRAVDLGADQITAYPLFGFPHAVGSGSLRLPGLAPRWLQYRALDETLTGAGFRRVSVWSYRRGSGPAYSSVTRDAYLGLGPGAASHLPGRFWLNTFSTPAWQERLAQGQHPTALGLAMGEDLERAWWLYWRLYETAVSDSAARERLGSRSRAALLLSALRASPFTVRHEAATALTREGAFWVHLLQNHGALGMVDLLWSACLERPFPDRVRV